MQTIHRVHAQLLAQKHLDSDHADVFASHLPDTYQGAPHTPFSAPRHSVLSVGKKKWWALGSFDAPCSCATSGPKNIRILIMLKCLFLISLTPTRGHPTPHFLSLSTLCFLWAKKSGGPPVQTIHRVYAELLAQK